jgi:hypothetical protein
MSDHLQQLKPPASITRKVLADWRSPRRGCANPEPLDNPLWRWLIKTGASAYAANQALGGPSPFKAGPMWCFDRMGQSRTVLEDGRTVLIAGEHEDYYDPDFYIYNDVVILNEGAEPRILGYEAEVFPPTDFHTASLLEDRIIVVGNLGYSEERVQGQTQVLVLDCSNWSVSHMEAGGEPPGWIHKHQAELQSGGSAILIKGGQVYCGERRGFVENLDDWLLHLAEPRWERLTNRRWMQFTIRRKDRELLHLWAFRSDRWRFECNLPEAIDLPELTFQLPTLEEQLGGPPRFELLPELYRPSIEHEALSEDPEEFGVFRVRIEGVVVRFVEESDVIRVVIEGPLSQPIVQRLREHVTSTLERLEYAPVVWKRVSG